MGSTVLSVHQFAIARTVLYALTELMETEAARARMGSMVMTARQCAIVPTEPVAMME